MKILLIVAHPDDEILGAGATIKKMVDRGDGVAVLTLGMSSATRELELREKQAESLSVVGVSARYYGTLEAMKFRYCDRHETVKLIESAIEAEQPDWIITHHPDDLHDDHKTTSWLAQEAARLPHRCIGYKHPVERVLFMEVATATDWSTRSTFRPNLYVSVSVEQLRKKAVALSVYDGVLRRPPHPRNEDTIAALARYRGAQAGLLYAEAFEIAQEVIT